MFTKILIANRGENGCVAAVSTNCLARAACAGDFNAENSHV
jgi:acetyl/propionyl-CoA carboxylase alpha subunit